MPNKIVHLRQLRHLILQLAGYEKISSRNCALLAELISQRTSRQLSETTLKRLYGFATTQFQLSNYTLDTLALFCGFKGWAGWRRYLNQTGIISSGFMAESRDFNKLFYYSAQAMWIFSTTTLQFLEVNNAACKFYGYNREQFLAMNILEIRPPEDKAITLETIAKAEEHCFHQQLFRHTLNNGDLITVDVFSYAFDWHGHAARLVIPLQTAAIEG